MMAAESTTGTRIIAGVTLRVCLRWLLSAGILIVVAIGVALGVLIGGILLSVVAYYMRR